MRPRRDHAAHRAGDHDGAPRGGGHVGAGWWIWSPGPHRHRQLTLAEMGYETVTPAATFYVLVRSPVADDIAFTERLAKEKVFVMPAGCFSCQVGSASR